MAKTAAKSCGFGATLLTHLFTDVIKDRNELCVQGIGHMGVSVHRDDNATVASTTLQPIQVSKWTLH